MEIQPTTLSGTKPSTDLLTVITISSLAYVVAVGMHEHGGHALACVLLGIRLKELGAFYVSFDVSQVPEISRRIVHIAGVTMGTVTGMASWIVLRYLPLRRGHAQYFFWLLGTISLLSSTGYLLFSGLSGIGDFGTTANGALYQMVLARRHRRIRLLCIHLGGTAIRSPIGRISRWRCGAYQTRKVSCFDFVLHRGNRLSAHRHA